MSIPNYTFSYDKDKMNETLLYASKSFSSIDGISSGISGLSIPADCPFSGELQGLLDSLKSSFEDINSCVNVLTNIKTIADNCVDSKNFLNEYTNVINSTGDLTHGIIQKVTLDCGQSGFIYIPEGNTNGKSLITWLSPDRDEGSKLKKGFGCLLSNRYKPDAVVWIPFLSNANDYNGWLNEKNLSLTEKAIAELIDKYHLDSNRNIVGGYSNGSYGAAALASRKKDYYSRVIIMGGAANTGDYPPVEIAKDGTVLGTSTTYVYIDAKGEQEEYNSINSYDAIRRNGGQAIKYSIRDAKHGDVESFLDSTILDDAINYRRGEKIDNYIYEDGYQGYKSEIVYIDKNVRNKDKNTWYVPLRSNGEGASSVVVNESPNLTQVSMETPEISESPNLTQVSTEIPETSESPNLTQVSTQISVASELPNITQTSRKSTVAVELPNITQPSTKIPVAAESPNITQVSTEIPVAGELPNITQVSTKIPVAVKFSNIMQASTKMPSVSELSNLAQVLTESSTVNEMPNSTQSSVKISPTSEIAKSVEVPIETPINSSPSNMVQEPTISAKTETQQHDNHALWNIGLAAISTPALVGIGAATYKKVDERENDKSLDDEKKDDKDSDL